MRGATGAVDTAVVLREREVPALGLARRCVMAEKRTTGYGRSGKWLAIYAIAGAVALLIVYLVFFSWGGGTGGLY